MLDVAESLVQQRGFNGFSYADVAADLGITTASLHYHFAGKAELGSALIRRYADRFFTALDVIEQRTSDAPARLHAYADLYLKVLSEDRLCLCGMLAADYATLPEPMRAAVLSFFDANEAWLDRILAEGRAAGELQFAGPSVDCARMVISSMEGAMLVARPYGDLSRFQSAADQLITGLRTKTPLADPRPSASLP
jgi:TetR/AcrR family transcriptional repressor of nem operon